MISKTLYRFDQLSSPVAKILKTSSTQIIITPEAPVDLSKFPTAHDEYTPRQRRIIDARLAKSLADTKAGRVSKVFSDHKEFIAALHEEAARLSAKRQRRPAK